MRGGEEKTGGVSRQTTSGRTQGKIYRSEVLTQNYVKDISVECLVTDMDPKPPKEFETRLFRI